MLQDNVAHESVGLCSIEICAGGGGQALGLEQAGFNHLALVEIEREACETLRTNRPDWNVIEGDVRSFDATPYAGKVDLLAGGVPCPPFSVAGKQLGKEDERDLFPEMLRLVRECNPRAVMIENVRGIFSSKFVNYRKVVTAELEELGYRWWWRIVNARDFGVPQLRPRAILVALLEPWASHFEFPEGGVEPPTVGETLERAMASFGWEEAAEWASRADAIAPTLVGGSKKHGGADLGPTRAKEAWKRLGVDAYGISDAPPAPGFKGDPKLTVQMAALIQGFPADWEFKGRKTPAYRQVGNAFPPPVARAIAKSIREVLADDEQ